MMAWGRRTDPPIGCYFNCADVQGSRMEKGGRLSQKIPWEYIVVVYAKWLIDCPTVLCMCMMGALPKLTQLQTNQIIQIETSSVAWIWMLADDTWRRALFIWTRAMHTLRLSLLWHCGAHQRASRDLNPSGFSYTIAKRRKMFSSHLVTFPNYSLRTIKKKCRVRSGQVRSGHPIGFVDTTSEKFAIMSVLEFFTERFLLFGYS